ncbi:hypothetical protein HDIA_4271 [Hartmannibacter diazotrophicus]|uniref:Guanylate cyclase domain-containing protein n=2 Tax=Hartmannibacter diazotrophicus TaxID=1482074 RepID=A0A2C9DBU8_9HYPH|nr:hypothetical protein HDIA_4271 [Hartmannibacter diazotrophicus]
MAADVANFGGMVSIDETSTLETIWTMRRIAREELALHGGWLFGLPGDGIFALFESTVDAVRCALETQRRLLSAPQLRTLRLRIGIHLGEVLFHEEQPFGETLVIAARLESQANPGGILISGPVMETVAPRINATFSERGVLALKHSPRRIEAFDILVDVEASNETTAATDELNHTMRAAMRASVQRIAERQIEAGVAGAISGSPAARDTPEPAAPPPRAAEPLKSPEPEQVPVETPAASVDDVASAEEDASHREPSAAAPSRHQDIEKIDASIGPTEEPGDAVPEEAHPPEIESRGRLPSVPEFSADDFPSDSFPIEGYYGEDVPLEPQAEAKSIEPPAGQSHRQAGQPVEVSSPAPAAAPPEPDETEAEGPQSRAPEPQPPPHRPPADSQLLTLVQPLTSIAMAFSGSTGPTVPPEMAPADTASADTAEPEYDPTSTSDEPIEQVLATTLIPDEFVADLAKILTLHVGPVAPVLVARAALCAIDMIELVDTVADAIPTETERQHFIGVAGLTMRNYRNRKDL